MFGARFQPPSDVTLDEVVATLADTAKLMVELAAVEPPAAA
jgi:hypothetical protein